MHYCLFPHIMSRISCRYAMKQAADVKLTHENSREKKKKLYSTQKYTYANACDCEKMPHKIANTFEVPVHNLKLNQDLN